MSWTDSNADRHDRSGHGFARILTEAVRRRRLTLQRVHDLLAERDISVSAVTLSYWMRGRTQPERPESLRAVAALEELLGLSSGRLSDALPTPRPRGPRTHLPAPADYADLWRSCDSMRRLVSSVGAPDRARLSVLAATDRYSVDGDRSCRRMELTQIVQAQENGVDRVLFLAERDGPGLPDQVAAARGGVLGRVRADERAGRMAVEVLLDQVLTRDETAVVACVIDFPPSGWDERSANRRFSQPARFYLLEVDFHPDSRPVRYLRTSSSTLQTDETASSEIRVGRSAAAHLALNDVPAGIHGLSWDWE